MKLVGSNQYVTRERGHASPGDSAIPQVSLSEVLPGWGRMLSEDGAGEWSKFSDDYSLSATISPRNPGGNTSVIYVWRIVDQDGHVSEYGVCDSFQEAMEMADNRLLSMRQYKPYSE